MWMDCESFREVDILRMRYSHDISGESAFFLEKSTSFRLVDTIPEYEICHTSLLFQYISKSTTDIPRDT
jgi:hypothetical protein